MPASGRNASISLFAMLAVAGCAREAPRPPPTANAPHAPAASAPALPAKIGICEAAPDHHGAWQPTLDDVVSAAAVMSSHCIPAELRVPAVRACAARLGRPTVTVGVGTIDDTTSCQESFVPAEWGGRRWIVRQTSHRDGASFSGSGAAVELRGGKAARYFENVGFVEDCDHPTSAPPDWPTLPADLRQFLCGFGTQ